MARKPHKYHYIYMITCIKNQRYYIGMHSTDNLNDGYMGGGKRIKNSVKKHGKDAHRKNILEFLETREDLRNREIQLVNEELINDPMCMNIQPGGGGGIINEKHLKDFCEAGNKAFQEKLKDKEYRDNFIHNTKKCREKGVARCKELQESGVLKMGFFKDKTHTHETILKMRESKKLHGVGNKNSKFGKKWIKNIETMECIKIDSSEYEKYIDLGWESGGFSDSAGSTAKLIESQVIEIKTMLSGNIRVSEIAKIFQISITTIRKINRGDIWTHVNLNRLN